MKTINILLLICLVLFSPLVFGLEECQGTINEEETPCLVLLPSNDCNPITIDFYFNASTFLYSTNMSTYSPFTCNATFNATLIGTYTFNYTTGDSGSIIITEGNMNFFNLLVYIVFTGISLILIAYMHKFKDDEGSSIVYGVMATTISAIMGAIILSPAFDVVKGVELLIDVNYYLAGFCFVIAMYTALVSWTMHKQNRPKETGY